ncbi:plastocyanin/azurin family copper-binding protein [Dyadobacter subterraneus]|uniref:Auracyanin family protein n=1 Tax=Dyadobacter subterraneus TaxID=2773304 RepID=A0ABR9WBY6_9BACT|nr:plastocyanin/azurin family copper-binding protein [Dyadobacter subterraneus]MBE9462933.1 auracyanin family protein [Dyadobacter subterraneus]
MKNIVLTTLLSLGCLAAQAQSKAKTEDDYYRIITMPIPQNIQMEVGGLAVLPDGRLAASTRRGEVWMISNPYMKGNGQPTFHRFASGLHEPLGLFYRGKDILLSQRGEVTRLVDTDNDGVADVYDSFARWPLSGNYHQYSYGPIPMPNGEMLVTLNLDWIGRGASQSKWRGWMLKLGQDGSLTPYATGLRSPAGFGSYKGDIFYTENQGDWVGSGRMTHLEKGDFAGNVAGLRWSSEPGSPVKLKPEDVPDTGEPLYDVAKRVPGIKPPAVWFPHTLMGISTSDFKEDTTGGAFGPFQGQLFVGDQGHSKVMRVDMEKVNGVYQGACFPFREGFESGIIRMVWGLDGSMFVGQTSRGWSATGKADFGIQRLVWTGQTPFEMKNIRSMPDGFEVTFTSPVDKATALKSESYKLSSFTYKYHHIYGSPIINTNELAIKGIAVSEDGLRARIVIDPATLRKGYIHELKAEGVQSTDGLSLLHNIGYYTLNEIAGGAALTSSQYTASSKPAMAHDMSTMTASDSKGAETNSAKRVTEMPASWTNGPDQVINIGTVPGLKFDISEIQVKAGSKIRLNLNNNDDMLHNLVVVKPGTANTVGELGLNLGLKGTEMNYVPKTNDVLFHTNIVEPEKTESIYFVAPKQVGVYQYLCTFPGHYTLMQGKLKVVK